MTERVHIMNQLRERIDAIVALSYGLEYNLVVKKLQRASIDVIIIKNISK